ncbi:hypothetical protein BH18THE2_BH18THE2_14030 [soil metagenome]
MRIDLLVLSTLQLTDKDEVPFVISLIYSVLVMVLLVRRELHLFLFMDDFTRLIEILLRGYKVV